MMMLLGQGDDDELEWMHKVSYAACAHLPRNALDSVQAEWKFGQFTFPRAQQKVFPRISGSL